MYQRILNLPLKHSFFLFGARATGKSTLLKQFTQKLKNEVIWIDLLEPEIEKVLSLYPSRLKEMIPDKKGKCPSWVVIDEVQKIPKLLDVVHKLLFEERAIFALTGSSARKLKCGHANLLAGRAFGFKLYPLSFVEMGESFVLSEVLRWGQLPAVHQLENDLDKRRYLQSYVQNYIKEEILVEQIIRNIEPFRAFLEVAAQSNTEIINYAKLAREAGIDAKSVERYFEVLEDTLIGHFLYPFSRSIRKRQSQKPKFYFFDLGVVRALSNSLDSLPSPGNYGYGKIFEHLVIIEALKLNDYYERNYKFSYLRTRDEVEIDLVLEKDKKIILIEVKSTGNVLDDDLRALRNIGREIPAKKYILCTEKEARFVEDINIVPWQKGLKEIFDF